MRCFGKYKNDRICDLCNITNKGMAKKCMRNDAIDEYCRINYTKCIHYKEDRYLTSGTNSLGYDETYEETEDKCKLESLGDGKCTPCIACYPYIKGGENNA